MGDAAAGAADRRQECDCADEHHEIARLNREQEIEIDGATREVDCPRRAASRRSRPTRHVYRVVDAVGRRAADQRPGDRSSAAPTPVTKQYFSEEARAPRALELGAEHPQRQHVEQQVAEAAVRGTCRSAAARAPGPRPRAAVTSPSRTSMAARSGSADRRRRSPRAASFTAWAERAGAERVGDAAVAGHTARVTGPLGRRSARHWAALVAFGKPGSGQAATNGTAEMPERASAGVPNVSAEQTNNGTTRLPCTRRSPSSATTPSRHRPGPASARK